MKIYSFSGKGNREINEDYYANIEFCEHSSLHVIADGMGGYSYGEVAAQTAVSTIINYLSEKYQEPDIEKNIQESLFQANEQIRIKQKELHSKLGATIAGIYINQEIAYAFWLGDVQIFHFRNQELLFVSESHSLINDMKKNGIVSTKDIERYGNIVTKSLSGTIFEEEIKISHLKLERDDCICLCSDGLYHVIDPQLLMSLSNSELDERMKAYDASVEDNYTLIRMIM